MLNELVKQMKEKGFDVNISKDGYMAVVYVNTYMGDKQVCYIYKSLKVESAKWLQEEQEKELGRVRAFVSKFKKNIMED